jgi:hypothetical protein
MSEIINPLTEEVLSYKCNWCNELYKMKRDADICALKHAKYNLANTLLKDGYPLSSIEYWCNFGWNLKDSQKDITKDNCFIMSHWQCCNKPAYRIVSIQDGGYLRLFGIGSWSGGYGNTISIDKLPIPHSKEELFVDERYP